MGAQASESYERLAELIESELHLIIERRFEELSLLDATRTALVAQLPAVPPQSARAALEHCVALNRQVREQLLRARATTLDTLAEVRRGRRAARGYAPFRRHPSRVSANA